ncbi:MAG TPA: hypothetical protein DEG17_17500 [Cyanobacteria bacterium UBA11149]|nr:hypothetical protein [Cyanobacteria bacterium UBA11367]HBE59952.1 hypothetical protein [Cyanobacteria bacterium UBA11366]HBK63716.1 hypothetical protein [Cyanobacteria bacterium UBA11166]HBR77120.1 hypothetical protein [Cyanobacteria bacterium UBA11159]HBS67721.1 hypothetical protein [Cyanobacteria bacterium UBA11153]HBW90618.1 hypothetical protein [Cyanobacteria bacterium UBA11149]HCA93668.1 hypothetical protein [Cyanobacteria bacterium UBA9226]
MQSKSTRIKSQYFLGIGEGICTSLFTDFAIAPLAFSIALLPHTVFAQIIPDNTLGAETSVVTPINSQINQIEGGAIRGANLFHLWDISKSRGEGSRGEKNGIIITGV